jgi:transcriptional regulator with XRE-family HTH domain
MNQTLVDQFVNDPKNLRLFLQERSIYEVTALIEDTMKEQGVSRSELATRLGKSKGWVTQLLDGEANKTIRTVADVFAVLGREFRAFQQPIKISNRSETSPSVEKVMTLRIFDGTATQTDSVVGIIRETA